MVTRKRTRANAVPLVIEEHPSDYKGYPFITLIQYRNQHVLAIIDNMTAKKIKMYILDLCGPAKVNEEEVIAVATDWYDNNRDRYPISFEFSKRGLSETFSKIYRDYPVDFVTRIIGPVPKFDMTTVHSVKRRRRKVVPEGMEIHYKTLADASGHL